MDCYFWTKAGSHTQHFAFEGGGVVGWFSLIKLKEMLEGWTDKRGGKR